MLVPASIYTGWINAAVDMSSCVLMSICMSHLHGWETKRWDVGKLAGKKDWLLLKSALNTHPGRRKSFIFTRFSVSKPKMSRNMQDRWPRLQRTPLRSSNPSPSNFCFHGKSCPVYVKLYYSPPIHRDVTGLASRQVKKMSTIHEKLPDTFSSSFGLLPTEGLVTF